MKFTALNEKEKKQYFYVGIGVGITFLLLDIIFFKDTKFHVPFMVFGILFIASPWITNYYLKYLFDKEIEQRFPDFIRNLVSSIKAGMTFPKALEHASKQNYGQLTPYVRKLNMQVNLGVPIYKAFNRFAVSVNNAIINRAVSTIIEAERSGGKLDEVLDSVTKSIYHIEYMKQKRQAGVKAQLIQLYVIFFVFLALIGVLYNVVIPSIASLNVEDTQAFIAMQGIEVFQREVAIRFSSPGAFIGTVYLYFTSMKGVLLMLGVFQGFFAGVILGRFSEGSFKAGLKHSLILVVIAITVLQVIT